MRDLKVESIKDGEAMIYKTLNRIFGWDYIQWRNFADSGIARVHRDGAGTAWYWRYKFTKVADRITDSGQVLWLTCKPSKYLYRYHDRL